MGQVYSNGPTKDFVINPFKRLAARASRLHLAAPFFTAHELVLEAVRQGKIVQLLVGLNAATSPASLQAVHSVPNLAVRYLTHRFHAKIFVFDDTALLGSSNLTDGGLFSNREATICLDQSDDLDAIEDVRALFHELWDAAAVLTDEKLRLFQQTCDTIRRQSFDPDALIEKAIGRVEPPNINVASLTKSRERVFLEDLRRQVYEQYRPSFDEVSRLLADNGLRRPELDTLGLAHETNRFLNWIRLTYVAGEDAWRSAPPRSQDGRRVEILRFGEEWKDVPNSRVEPEYAHWLNRVLKVFGSKESIAAASKDELTNALMSVHAFVEQLRFVQGGAASLPAHFWNTNGQDVERVKRSLSYLIHDGGEFISRLHDVLYDPARKIRNFGYFCALELFGTLKPQECPPMNGRMAKALRFLGFEVRAA